jgi:hypothetical protein
LYSPFRAKLMISVHAFNVMKISTQPSTDSPTTLLDPPGLILNSVMLMRSTSEERVGVLYGLPRAFFAIRF